VRKYLLIRELSKKNISNGFSPTDTF